MPKIIQFNEPYQIEKVVEELKQSLIEDSVTDAVLIYRIRPKDKNKKTIIHRYWFTDNSTMRCLGLARHMCDEISRYIDEDDEFIDDN
jgi:hypothetical protein